MIGTLNWNFNATQIVFVSNRSGNDDIWVMNADSSNQQALTTDPADEQHADWSADGTRIMFRSDRTGNNEIWTYTFPNIVQPASVVKQ